MSLLNTYINTYTPTLSLWYLCRIHFPFSFTLNILLSDSIHSTILFTVSNLRNIFEWIKEQMNKQKPLRHMYNHLALNHKLGSWNIKWFSLQKTQVKPNRPRKNHKTKTRKQVNELKYKTCYRSTYNSIFYQLFLELVFHWEYKVLTNKDKQTDRPKFIANRNL